MNRTTEAFMAAQRIIKTMRDAGFEDLRDLISPVRTIDVPDYIQWESGATRLVIWDDECDYVIKIALESFYEKYNKHEVDIYKDAEKESVEDDLFNKSFWRMGMHDSNAIPRPMADTSTNEGDAESATITDCISRQAAIEQIDKWHDFYADSSLRTDKARRDELSAIKAMLINLPSLQPVTPTERTGEWIPCTKGGLSLTELGRREGQKWYGYKCSKCNFIYKGNALTESPFCQDCGAKMKGGPRG